MHVGGDDDYLALYSRSVKSERSGDTYTQNSSVNHVSIVVEDLDVIEKKVSAAGYKTHSHANYEPGKRFYF